MMRMMNMVRNATRGHRRASSSEESDGDSCSSSETSLVGGHEKLGSGGNSVVIASEDGETAVKIVHMEENSDEGIPYSVLREVHAMQSIGSPYVPRMVSVGLSSEAAAVSMPMYACDMTDALEHGSVLCESLPRRWRVRGVERKCQPKYRMTPRAIEAAASHVLVALVAARRRNIFHRDVKPENIFVEVVNDVSKIDDDDDNDGNEFRSFGSVVLGNILDTNNQHACKRNPKRMEEHLAERSPSKRPGDARVRFVLGDWGFNRYVGGNVVAAAEAAAGAEPDNIGADPMDTHHDSSSTETGETHDHPETTRDPTIKAHDPKEHPRHTCSVATLWYRPPETLQAMAVKEVLENKMDALLVLCRERRLTDDETDDETREARAEIKAAERRIEATLHEHFAAFDSWSLGCALLEFARGTPLFVGLDTCEEMMAAIDSVFAKVSPTRERVMAGYAEHQRSYTLSRADAHEIEKTLGVFRPQRFPAVMWDLIFRLLDKDPARRMTVEDALLKHDFVWTHDNFGIDDVAAGEDVAAAASSRTALLEKHGFLPPHLTIEAVDPLRERFGDALGPGTGLFFQTAVAAFSKYCETHPFRVTRDGGHPDDSGNVTALMEMWQRLLLKASHARDEDVRTMALAAHSVPVDVASGGPMSAEEVWGLCHAAQTVASKIVGTGMTGMLRDERALMAAVGWRLV